MKKYLFLLSILLLPITVNASSASLNITTSKTNVSVNDTITVTTNLTSEKAIGYYEYTIDYDHAMLRLKSGNTYIVGKANNNDTKSLENELKFVVTKAGTSKINAKSYVVTGANNKNLSLNVTPLTIVAKKSNKTLSSNNNLTSLEIENYKLNETFSKKNTNYDVNIEDDITEINIKTKTENENATVNGDGIQKVKAGNNKFEIVVVAENGDEKTYIINVNVSNPKDIIVKVNNKNYTVIKKLDDIDAPNSFQIKAIKFEKQNIEVLYSDTTKQTLIALKDENNNTSLFIYDEKTNTFESFNALISEKTTIITKEESKKPKGYTLYIETINGNSVNCYKLKEDSKYCLVYGTNLKTNADGWYVYDLKDGTIQRYDKELDNYYDSKITNTQILIYILSATTLLFGITTIAFAVKSNKKKHK